MINRSEQTWPDSETHSIPEEPTIMNVPTRAAEKYIRAIRNADKQAYARAYYNWILA